jgi:N-acetylmuramoyl-L-alanine amidase
MQISSLRAFVFASALFAAFLSDSRADSNWQIIKVDNREYLSVENIAHFYQLQGEVRTVDHRITLGDSRVRFELTGNSREIYINGVKQWLSFPMISQNGHLLISRFDLAKTIEPCLRPTMIANLQPFHTIVLDAGHGGQDRGANSTTGFEKDYTLSVIKYLKKSLENKGFHVLMTRNTDVFVPLDGRAQRANEEKDAIFVSVHFNSSNDGGNANGFEVFAMTPRGALSTGDSAASLEQFKELPGNDFDNASLALATCVHHSLLGHIPQTDRGVKRARFVVLKNTHAPAVLVEGGFLTNASESSSINDNAWRQKLAESIAEGVQSYAGLADNKIAPRLLADYRNEQLPFIGTIVNPNALAAVNTPRVDSGAVVPVSNTETSVPAPAINSEPVSGSPTPAPVH